MDLLQMLREKILSLHDGDYTTGLKAILVHLDAARRHWDRGLKLGDTTAFTDTIYRTNQAFEGSIKEAFRVLASKNPDQQTPYNIEKYLIDNEVFRQRVLGQFSSYRTDWRNPSTHDYRLDFDSSESFLAIVSVAAFACLLLDQIIEKVAFDTASQRIAAQPETKPAKDEKADTTRLLDLLQSMIVSFCNDSRAYPDKNHNEAQLLGALHAYLVSSNHDLSVQVEPLLSATSRARCDMLVKRGSERVIIEIKRSVRYQYNDSILFQVARYMDFADIKESILFFGPREKQNMVIVESKEQITDGVVKIICPSSFAQEAANFPDEFSLF